MNMMTTIILTMTIVTTMEKMPSLRPGQLQRTSLYDDDNDDHYDFDNDENDNNDDENDDNVYNKGAKPTSWTMFPRVNIHARVQSPFHTGAIIVMIIAVLYRCNYCHDQCIDDYHYEQHYFYIDDDLGDAISIMTCESSLL